MTVDGDTFGRVYYLNLPEPEPYQVKVHATYGQPLRADPRACVDCWQAGFHRIHGSYEVCPHRWVR